MKQPSEHGLRLDVQGSHVFLRMGGDQIHELVDVMTLEDFRVLEEISWCRKERQAAALKPTEDPDPGDCRPFDPWSEGW